MTKIPRYTAPITVQGRVYTVEELEARDREAFRAADLHASGYKPKPSDLEGAPRIDDWAPRVFIGPDGQPFISLEGVVTGHPNRRLPTPMSTSLIIAIDEKGGWARTYSRYYVLGAKRDLFAELKSAAAPTGDDTTPLRELSEPADGYDPRDHGGETYPTDGVRPQDDVSGDDDDDDICARMWGYR